ncbi:MAG: class II glutamine amidotransferase [Promethearchaeota archaeon]
MCRLFAVIGINIPAHHYMQKFRELAEFGKTIKINQNGHKDGWGIAKWSENADLTLVAKHPTDAYRDPNYDLAVQTFKESTEGIIFGHLRAASKGGINYENTHPFLDEETGMVFMHNGTVFFENSTEGPTMNDSRQYFQYLLQNFQHEGTMHGAFNRTIAQFATEHIEFSSATAFIANSSGVWVFRSYSRDEEYYTVYYLKMPDHYLICQEPIIKGNWQTLENDTLMFIPWENLTPQFYSIPVSHSSEIVTSL